MGIPCVCVNPLHLWLEFLFHAGYLPVNGGGTGDLVTRDRAARCLTRHDAEGTVRRTQSCYCPTKHEAVIVERRLRRHWIRVPPRSAGKQKGRSFAWLSCCWSLRNRAPDVHQQVLKVRHQGLGLVASRMSAGSLSAARGMFNCGPVTTGCSITAPGPPSAFVGAEVSTSRPCMASSRRVVSRP